MERLDVLMRVLVDHAVNKGVFSKFEFDVFCGLRLTSWEPDVEGDVVSSFVQYVPLRDLRLWSVIFPSSCLVSLRPFVGTSRRASCS